MGHNQRLLLLLFLPLDLFSIIIKIKRYYCKKSLGIWLHRSHILSSFLKLHLVWSLEMPSIINPYSLGTYSYLCINVLSRHIYLLFWWLASSLHLVIYKQAFLGHITSQWLYISLLVFIMLNIIYLIMLSSVKLIIYWCRLNFLFPIFSFASKNHEYH